MENLTLESIRNKKLEREMKFIEFAEKVRKEMLLNKVLYSSAKFECFTDNMFIYGYSNKNLYFQFTIICDDTLLSKMTINELLNLKRIKFFESKIFDKKEMIILGSLLHSN
jgi:hypothetical protein